MNTNIAIAPMMNEPAITAAQIIPLILSLLAALRRGLVKTVVFADIPWSNRNTGR